MASTRRTALVLLTTSWVAISLAPRSSFWNIRSYRARRLFRQLPPGFGLQAISQSVGPAEIRDPTHQAPEAVRPTCVGQEGTKHRPAEKLPAGADLRRDGELAEPAVVLPRAVCVVESPFERQRDIFGEEDLRPSAERHPVVPAVLRIPVFQALVDEDGHDCKVIVRLVE